MLNEYTIQSLKYLIAVSNSDTPIEVTATADEDSAVDIIKYAKQLFGEESKCFDDAMKALGIDKYCEASILRDAQFLFDARRNASTDYKDALERLVSAEIPSDIFKKAVANVCLTFILRMGLIAEYKDYVEHALDIIKNPDIADHSNTIN